MIPFYSGRLSFEDFVLLKEQMQELSTDFQKWASKTSSLVHHAKQEHNPRMRELTQKKNKLAIERAALLLKLRQHEETEETSKKSLKDKREMIVSLTDQLHKAENTKKELQIQIKEAREETEALEKSYEEIKKNIAMRNEDGLDVLSRYETYLGFRVEAVAEDHLMFRFFNIDVNDLDREVSCNLFVGGEDYKVGLSVPKLTAEQTQLIEADLNEHGDIILFLKHIRTILKNLIRDFPSQKI